MLTRIEDHQAVSVPVPLSGSFNSAAEASVANMISGKAIAAGYVEHRNYSAHGHNLTSITYYPKGHVPFGQGPGQIA